LLAREQHGTLGEVPSNSDYFVGLPTEIFQNYSVSDCFLSVSHLIYRQLAMVFFVVVELK
jgi:hypothetical protein